MHIAVLGGGNGSFAAAGDFTLAGHDVRLWRRDREAIAVQRASGGVIVVKDFRGRHEAKPALVTDDIAAAVRGAELIVCPAPAPAQADIARLLAPHLTKGQVVFLQPGTFGSFVFARAAQKAATGTDVAFAETGTLPWLTRKHGPFEVAITVRAKRLPTGVLPLRLAVHALAVIGAAFPGVIEPCGDALSGASDECRLPDHSYRRFITMERRRRSNREAFDYGPPHFPLANHYAREGEEWMYGRGSHDKLTDSGDWREHIVLTKHRYMLEDVRFGLSFLVSAGARAGVATPLAHAFMAIGSAICAEDFMLSGRTFQSFSLGDLNLPALNKILAEGFA